MTYPSLEEVEVAGHEDICRWWRFLSSPENPQQIETMNLIGDRLKKLGGFTPTISKKIGWDW